MKLNLVGGVEVVVSTANKRIWGSHVSDCKQ